MRGQELIHWLEQGAGARGLVRAALLLAVLALSAIVAFKQFHGARSEETLRQANLGRSLAEGRGFTTPVNDPQAHAFLSARGVPFRSDQPFPDLYAAPGYPLAIAAALALVPGEWREAWMQRPPAAPEGFGGDYALLVLNVILLWIAAAQTWQLGRALFDPIAGPLAALALLLSVAAWEHAVSIDGTPLAMVLLLAVFQAVHRAVVAGAGWRAVGGWLLAGAASGGLALTDYPAAALLPLVAGFAFWRQRWRAAAWVLAGALVIATPWIVRNLAVSGRPLALADQDVALRAGDPTAEPARVRATLAPESPPISLNKVGNKTLTALQQAVRERLWAGGGLFLTAFFVAGWLYRFRRDETNQLRTLVTLSLFVLVLAQGAFNSGEGERPPTAVAAPLVMIFGAGFFTVLVTSSRALASRPRLAAAGLLLVQAAPLLQDVLEPRPNHFNYPPYHPPFFQGMRAEMTRRGGDHPAWMADVPAGAAWYSGQRVWAQPASLRDFYAVHAEQPLLALVLTPHTLDRPFFGELAAPTSGAGSRFGDWSAVYRALAREQTPPGFPLGQAQKVTDNFYVLMDARRVPWRGK